MREVAELLGGNGQLAAAARVRPDRAQMEVADRHSELILRCRSHRASTVHLRRIVIDVGVEIRDLGHRLLGRGAGSTVQGSRLGGPRKAIAAP